MYNMKRYLNSIIILISTGLLCILGPSCLSSLGQLYADGWLKRQVIITIVDANTLEIISDTRIKVTEPNYMQTILDNDRIKKEKKYNGITDSKGVAELFLYFAFSSKTRWGITTGSFSLKAGTVHVQKEGYEPFESEFSQLVDETQRSVNNKSSIKICIKLKPLLNNK